MSVLLMGTPPRRRDIAEISSSSVSSSSSSDTKTHNSCEEERVERGGEGEAEAEGVGEALAEGEGGGGGGGEEVADLEQEEIIDGKEEFVVSPIVPLRDQLEKDKDDESLRRWKEQLLGSIMLDPVEEGVEPEVRVLGLSILSNGRPDIVIPLPLPPKTKSHLFTLKEGSAYNIKFTFSVRRNIVSGLTYIHTVWKNGFRVDNTKVMLGTFGPQSEPYTYVMEEEITPSGILARGSYSSRTKLVDDDGRVHLEINHTFDIRKDW